MPLVLATTIALSLPLKFMYMYEVTEPIIVEVYIVQGFPDYIICTFVLYMYM